MNFQFLLDKVIHETLTPLFLEIGGLIPEMGDWLENCYASSIVDKRCHG